MLYFVTVLSVFIRSADQSFPVDFSRKRATMTDNIRPGDKGPEIYETDVVIAGGQESTLSPAKSGGVPASPFGNTPSTSSHGAGSTVDTAKEEAGAVTHQAKDAAQNVAETAKSEATKVVAEVRTNARDVFSQAISDLSEQAATQQQKLAEGLRSVSGELHAMVSASDQSGVATDLVRQAAERTSAVASWLEGHDPGSVLAEMKSYARAKPGTFLLFAAGAGIVAGRLSRSLSAGAPDTDGVPRSAGLATDTRAQVNREDDTASMFPPAPEEPPTLGTAEGGVAGDYLSTPRGDIGTFPADQSGTEAYTGTDRPELWRAEPIETDPLPNADPRIDDPFDGGRR